ncbi:hypothetical protein GS501_02545 [Saccharibacter sp. 17.LH.SD]|uniref:hypothetical protein n=1 Tax=Saccharibacter sp. 17.LH.SD TaxID=2689393 RepID=UPI00136A647A|nr:hypothetical protein [Saccharibacter sp. 17.LH.SD]MXV43932.1 hypothetical protein [Saccharibacter sp. 17.LH.SD]
MAEFDGNVSLIKKEFEFRILSLDKIITEYLNAANKAGKSPKFQEGALSGMISYFLRLEREMYPIEWYPIPVRDVATITATRINELIKNNKAIRKLRRGKSYDWAHETF